MSWILQAAILFSIATKIHAKNAMYGIERIDKNPGIYYEKLELIKFKKLDWQIIVVVDTDEFLNKHYLKNSHQNVIMNCSRIMPIEQCELILSKNLIEAKYQKLQNTRRQIQERIEDITYTEQDYSAEPKNFRTKRLAPLGIIGSISKSLFGTATTDDIDLVNKNIDKIFEDQKNIIRLNKENSHIVQEQLQELRNVSEAHSRILRTLEQNIEQKLNELDRGRGVIGYMLDLMIYTRRFEATLEHEIESSQQLLQIIMDLSYEKINPALLKQDILHRMVKDIIFNTDLDLPIPMEHLRAEEIAKISAIDAVHQNGKLLAILHVPLVENTPYHLYQLHSIITMQRIGKSVGTAYITPKQPYLAMQLNHEHYVSLGHEDLWQCQKIHYARVCTLSKPVKNTALSKECEVNLLIDPTTENLKHCEVKYNGKNETQWRYLKRDGSWLFSAVMQENLHISCTERTEQTIPLHGIGILRIAEGCTARTKVVELFNNKIKNSGKQYIYKPELHLNIDSIYPELSKKISQQQEERIEIPTISSWHSKEKSIQDIMDEMKVMGDHQREKNYTNSVIYGGIGFQTCLITGIIILIIWIKRKKPRNIVQIESAVSEGNERMKQKVQEEYIPMKKVSILPRQ